MNYLSALGENTTLINTVHNLYAQHKTFTPQSHQAVFIEAASALDFTSPSHQLFYFLYHTLANEE